jgi:hypothetical protein
MTFLQSIGLMVIICFIALIVGAITRVPPR